MKTVFRLSCLVVCCLLGVHSAVAQSPNPSPDIPPPPTPKTAWQSLQDYFTQFNPEYPATARVELWTGAVYQNGINFADDLGARVNFSPGGNGFTIEALGRNAGIAGTVVGLWGGPGWRFVHVDTALTAGIDAGYNFDEGYASVIPYIEVRKMTTLNSYALIRLGLQLGFTGPSIRNPDNRIPELTVGVGIKF